MTNYVNKGVKIATAVLVVAVIISALVPSAIGAFTSDKTEINTQTVDNSTDVGVLESTVTNVDTTNNQATLELNKTGESYSESQTLDLNTTSTYTYDGDSMDVTVTEIVDSDTVKIEYTYGNTFGWSSAASALFVIIPLFLILALLMFAIGYVKVRY